MTNEVWALVSGLPSGERERRVMMTLQAFIDDSGSDTNGDAFVLGGYIAPAEKWAKFTDEWVEALAKPPSLDYFKTVEAVNLRGQFKRDNGWTPELRNARVIELAEIIWRYCSVSISATLKHSDWADTVKQLAPLRGQYSLSLEHPYVFLWQIMLSELWLHPTKLALGKGPCDFIFDTQTGFDVEALQHWKVIDAIMKDSPRLPDHIRNWIQSPPVFRDEKQFRPLQAADLFAWANRRALTHEPDNLKLPTEALERLQAVPAMHLPVKRDYLIAQALSGLRLLRGEAP